jgi:MFS transporter, SP family, arabinose:H+ symporter
MGQPGRKTNQNIYLISAVAALGGLLFGYDTAVISGSIGFIQKKFELSAAMTGWAASSAIWGCVVGALLAGYVSDLFGRKKILLVTAVLFAASAIGSAIPENLSQFIFARFVGGLGVGAASMLSPLYIAEIAPSKIRGRLVTLYQLAIVIGINIIYLVNLKIEASGGEVWNIETGWRLMVGSEIIPATLFFITLFLVPESPRWLTSHGKNQEAMDVLSKVNSPDEAVKVMDQIRLALGEETGAIRDLLKPGMRTAMIVGIVLALFSQITGINAIIYYAPEIFKSVGFSTGSALLQTVIIGLTSALFTFVAIKFIDRVGRKTLLLWGVSGMTLCLLVISLLFYFDKSSGPWLLIFILGYIACFAFSLGPIPWVIISEIFPTKTRGTAMSFATVTLWVGVLLITQLTPILLESIGGAFTFLIFMVNAVILLLFTKSIIPETKGKTLEEIELGWKDYQQEFVKN